jgi:hypothetical protein
MSFDFVTMQIYTKKSKNKNILRLFFIFNYILTFLALLRAHVRTLYILFYLLPPILVELLCGEDGLLPNPPPLLLIPPLGRD